MSEYAKPLPDPDLPATAPFWRGTRESTLLVQRCDDCLYLRWPPGPACPECLSWTSTWVPVEPAGNVITYCVYHRAFSASFAEDVPYAVGYVQLHSGPRMYGTLLGPTAALRCGAPVTAAFVAATSDVTLVHWAIDEQD